MQLPPMPHSGMWYAAVYLSAPEDGVRNLTHLSAPWGLNLEPWGLMPLSYIAQRNNVSGIEFNIWGVTRSCSLQAGSRTYEWDILRDACPPRLYSSFLSGPHPYATESREGLNGGEVYIRANGELGLVSPLISSGLNRVSVGKEELCAVTQGDSASGLWSIELGSQVSSA